MEFMFEFEPTGLVPRDLVYLKPLKQDVHVAYQNAKLVQDFMGAGTMQETLLYLKPNQVEKTAECYVVFTDLDDGLLVEWRAELRRPDRLPPDPKAQDRMHLHHGHLPAATIHAKGVSYRQVARQLATQALNEYSLKA